MTSHKRLPVACSVYIERAGREQGGISVERDVARRLYGMSKESLIIPMIVLLAAAGVLFSVAGYLTGWKRNRPDQVKGDGYLRAVVGAISTQICGTVRKVNVNDYQCAKAGRTLIELGDGNDPTALNQTQAALAMEIVGLQVRRQAFALAVSDSFLLIATCCVACLVVVS